jgi:predicted nucleotide-binding protein
LKTAGIDRSKFSKNRICNKARQELVNPEGGILGVYLRKDRVLCFLVSKENVELPTEFMGIPVGVIFSNRKPAK